MLQTAVRRCQLQREGCSGAVAASTTVLFGILLHGCAFVSYTIARVLVLLHHRILKRRNCVLGFRGFHCVRWAVWAFSLPLLVHWRCVIVYWSPPWPLQSAQLRHTLGSCMPNVCPIPDSSKPILGVSQHLQTRLWVCVLLDVHALSAGFS